MRLNSFFRIVGIVAVAVLFASMLSCAKDVKREIYVSFFTGDVSLLRGGTQIKVEVKAIVQEGDILTVGDKSTLILQGEDGLVVRFESNTEAVLLSLKEITKREITLNKGKVLSSVAKLQKGNGYSVKTPTAVASVRGTQFLTVYDGKRSIVAVGSGVVSVKGISGTGDEKSVDKGNTAVVESDDQPVSLREVNRVETLELSKLEKTPVVEKVETKTPEEIMDIFRETEKNDENINELIKEETGLSPAEMKAKYGRIDVITLYNGRVIQGIIVSRGAGYRVLTTSGVITINAKDVKRTDVK